MAVNDKESILSKPADSDIEAFTKQPVKDDEPLVQPPEPAYEQAIDAIDYQAIYAELEVELQRTEALQANAQAQLEATHQAQATKETTEELNKDSPALATQFLSRFGLRGPEDIQIFLDSPAGETVKEELGAILAEEKAMQEYEEFRRQELEKRRQRMLALLMLYLASKSSHAKKLKAEVESAIHDFLEKQKELLQRDDDTPSYTDQEAFEGMEKKVGELQERLDENQNELDQLDNELELLEEALQSLDAQMEENLLLHDKLESELQEITPDKPFKALSNEERESFNKDLAERLQQIETQLSKEGFTPTESLKLDIDAKTDAFIREMGFKHHRLQMMRNVLDGTHRLFDEDFNEVDHMDKAHFCMSEDASLAFKDKDLRVVQKDGEKYLIPKGKELQDLSPEETNNAKNAYKKQMTPEKHAKLRDFDRARCHHHREHLLSKRQTHLTQRMEKMCERVKLCSELQKAQAWIANYKAQQQMEDPAAPQQQQQQPASPAPSQTSITASYKTVLNQIRKNPSLEDVQTLRSTFGGKVAASEMDTLAPGKSIPPATLKRMQSATLPPESQKKLLATMIKNHPEFAKESRKLQGSEMSKDTQMARGPSTPFSTTLDLDPYKK